MGLQLIGDRQTRYDRGVDLQLLTADLKQYAAKLGFSLCGVCPAIAPPGSARLDEWLAAGYAGQMHYLAERREAYNHPGSVLEGAQSVLMLALNYRTVDPTPPGPGQGRVSRYAWSDVDYHDLIRSRLNRFGAHLQSLVPEARVRGVVDTAPLLERDFAELAGLGWIGKNTLLLNREQGSWFFLAALLTDVELDYDAAHKTDHCGTCRACLDACPTGAFPQPYVLDASRCISYLTIELRDAIPAELRSGIGDWLFGCDVCQEVCPWNSRGPQSGETAFAPRSDANPIELVTLFDLDDDAFRGRFRHTPLWRAKRRGILRNAAIVLGNQRDLAAVPTLARGLDDVESLVRCASAWALGCYSDVNARQVLERRLAIETDSDVVAEILSAMGGAIDEPQPKRAESNA